MFKSGFVLETNLHLDAAKFNQTVITVWIEDHIIDYCGYIKSFTEDSVTIDEFKYLRAISVFKVR